jgi:hypothetical protein
MVPYRIIAAGRLADLIRTELDDADLEYGCMLYMSTAWTDLVPDTQAYIVWSDPDESLIEVIEMEQPRIVISVVLQFPLVRDVWEVVKLTRPDATDEEVVAALNYFLYNDAFLDFEDR